MKNRVKGWIERVRKLLERGIRVPIPAAAAAFAGDVEFDLIPQPRSDALYLEHRAFCEAQICAAFG